jgi:transcriptional regulator with XRE-family HTH domain
MESPDEASRRLADAVASAMAAACVSQREVAGRAGIPLTTLNRRLTGRSPFLVTELASIASVLGVSVVDIVKAAYASGRAA